MASNDEIQFEAPFIHVYKSGRVERFGHDFVPASVDTQIGVSSKDAVINPQTGVSARIYLPTLVDVVVDAPRKLPVLVYYHGGAFCIGSPFSSLCHYYLNPLAAQFNVIVVSVDYRLAPEHPIPAAYDDSWEALKWVASHAEGGSDPWLTDHADLGRLFLAGDSAGGNIVHHMAMRAGCEQLSCGVQIEGLVMMHPYFLERKEMDSEEKGLLTIADMEKTWKMTCPSTTGVDDQRINPMADGAPSLSGLTCKRVLVCVAEKDLLRDGGRGYYQKLRDSGWRGEVEFFETEGEGHMFHIFNPTTEKVGSQARKISDFLNRL